jgi:ribulose-5-phosphate 4-epimerase/fuculose-1-phosphate aldolase
MAGSTRSGPLPEAVAAACRVLAERGLVEHVLGHISVRTGPDTLLVRCRGPHESGLAYTTAEDIHPVPLSGPVDVHPWSVPNELPIHRELLRRRPEVTAVVHAHPPAVVAHSLLDEPLQPIYGAYDIPGAALAAGGVPVWPRAVLVNTDALAGDLAAALGDRPVVVLRGHGLVSVGEGDPAVAVPLAVLRAVAVDTLARTTLRVRHAGGRPEPIDPADLAGLPDLGSGFTVDTMWRHLLRRLDNAGAALLTLDQR